MRLAYAAYLDAIAEESDRLEDLAERGLNKRVPSHPEWTLRQLAGHAASVYDFWIAQLLAAHPEGAVEVTTRTFDPGELASKSDELAAALETAGPEGPCWNWSGEELTASWVARRMALDSAVHRVDGEQSQRGNLPIDTELAIDGIDERIAVHLPYVLGKEPGASLGGSICLVCSDAPAAWVVEVDRGRLRWRHGRGPADTALVGRASEVFLFTWDRLDARSFSVTGDLEVAEAWQQLPS